MNELQQKLTSYAYNITGSYEDARDVVQDVYLELMGRNEEMIADKNAYLTRSVINRAINYKKRQQKILPGYPGKWLPEPVATERADASLDQKDILNYSMMVLLEKLNPRQRAVFILKEAFEYEHEEIAAVLGITVENSRKILSRAKKELGSNTKNDITPVPAGYLQQYLDAIRSRDMKKLEQLLSDDVTLISDGGGKVPAAINTLTSREQVVPFLLGIFHKFYSTVHIEPATVNHQPAIFYYHKNELVTCQIFIVRNERIDHVYFMRNPDKLKLLQNDTAIN